MVTGKIRDGGDRGGDFFSRAVGLGGVKVGVVVRALERGVGMGVWV